jgi:hypothetical protein
MIATTMIDFALLARQNGRQGFDMNFNAIPSLAKDRYTRRGVEQDI